MAKKEKEFNFKLYGISVFLIIAALLVVITATTFKSKYTAFHPEAVAKNYVDTIVQTGDGYNAYKNSLLGKNQKYGDFIREYYMYPVIDRDVNTELDAVTDSSLPKGYNNDIYKGEKTLNDDGSLQGQLIDAMYPYYEKLVDENGWDNYDKIFTEYFEKLIKVRKEIFEDDYMSDEVMFTALEANVRTYGEKLTGTEDAFDENTGLQTSFKTVGKYEEVFGEDYKLVVSSDEGTELDINIYKDSCDKEALATYGVSTDDITEVREYTVDVASVENYEGEDIAKVVATADVVVVKIGSSYYVDNMQTKTDVLYNFYK